MITAVASCIGPVRSGSALSLRPPPPPQILFRPSSDLQDPLLECNLSPVQGTSSDCLYWKSMALKNASQAESLTETKSMTF